MTTDTMPETGFFEKHRDRIAFAGPDDCWLWTAGKFSDGYGSVKVRGKSRRTHREAYEAENGVGSADGLVVRHKCDVPLCVNHAHLKIGTQADNMRDKMERGRQARQKGEAHGNAKLTESDVRTIRAAYVSGSRTHGLRALARQFGVDPSLIGYIARRKAWDHVP